MVNVWRAMASLVVSAAVLSGCATSTAPTPAVFATPTASPLPSSIPTASPAATQTPTAPVVSPTTGATDARVSGWRSDLEMLVPRMDAFHPALDHGTSLAELNGAASDLAGRVPELTDDELMVQVLGIVAMVSRSGCDGHTGAYVWGSGSYPVDSLPLRLWLFDDAVYIVDALPPHEDLLGLRIDSVGGHPIAEVLEAIDPIVPRDNTQTVRLLMPRFLLIPQILRGFRLIDASGPISLGLVDSDGSPRMVELGPIPMSDYNDWAGPYGLHLPDDPDVPYLSRIGDDIWWERLEDGTLFVQYNRVEFSALAALTGIADAAADPATTRVVLDLRHNFGGEASALEPVVSLMLDPTIDRPGKLFVVTGRNTFSAGSMIVARLDAESDAVVVGESMGGCPTFWADTESFELPYSHVGVSVSTTFEVAVDPDDARGTIEPDLPAVLTPEDWASGTDPALDAIRARVP